MQAILSKSSQYLWNILGFSIDIIFLLMYNALEKRNSRKAA